MHDDPFTTIGQLPTQNENPYASPAGRVPENREKTKRLTDARFGVVLAAVFSSGMALLFVYRFAVNLVFRYPFVIDEAPFWMVGHLIHGAGCTLVAWRLVQYQAMLERMNVADDAQDDSFVAAHAALWRTVMFVLLVFIANRVAFTNFTTWGFLDW